MEIIYEITPLWDEWLIFSLGNHGSEDFIRLPFENPFKEADQEKLPRERKIEARSRTKARGMN
jgi:hypothetical protein